MSTQDDERTISDLLKQHPSIMEKLMDFFRGGREISPDQERELDALAEQLKQDITKGSRDLPSGNVSPEDQQRWITAAISAAYTGYKLYKENPGAVKAVTSVVKKIWPW